MRKLFTILAAAAVAGSFSAYAANGDNFTYQGIKYTVIDETAATVETMASDGYFEMANAEYVGDAVIPEQVEYNGSSYTVIGIGEFSFYYDSDLTGITLPKTIQYIGESALYNTSISEITLPDGITEIGSSSMSANNITELTIPASVTSIGKFAFHNNQDLKTVYYKTDVEIPDHCFTQCSIEAFYCYAETLVLVYNDNDVFSTDYMPNSTLYVPAGLVNAYENSGGYQWPYYFAHIEAIGDEGGNEGGNEGGAAVGDTFEYQGIKYTILDVTAKTVETMEGDGYFELANGEFVGNAVIPSQVEYKGTNYTVIGIGEYSFYWDDNLTGITLPETLQYIADSGLYRNNITEITIPASLTTLGASALGYTKITELTVPETVTSIGRNAFAGNSNLTTVHYKSEAKIPATCFVNCPITEFYCYATTPPVLGTEAEVFSYDVYEDGTLYVPAGSVEAYKNSGDEQWPYYFSTIKAMGDEGGNEGGAAVGDTFEYEGIYYTILDIEANTVETMAGDGMYEDANGYYEGNGVIPAQVEYQDVTYTVVKIGDYSFYYDSDLTNLTIPSTVTAIGEAAFYHTGITSVEIPESVTSLGENAFGWNTELTTITLPAIISSLPGNVFYMCPIEAFYCYAVTPPYLADRAFSDKTSGYMENAVLYVPAGSVEAYQTSGQYQWPYYFANIQAMEGEETEAVSVTLNLTSNTTEGNLASYVKVSYEEAEAGDEGIVVFVDNSFTSEMSVPAVITIEPEDGFVVEVAATQSSESVKVTAPAENSTVWTVNILSGAPETIFLNVTVSDLEVLGVLAIDGDNDYKVYNLQGVRVLESKDASGLDRLPAGIYIINGKKVMIGK